MKERVNPPQVIKTLFEMRSYMHKRNRDDHASKIAEIDDQFDDEQKCIGNMTEQQLVNNAKRLNIHIRDSELNAEV